MAQDDAGTPPSLEAFEQAYLIANEAFNRHDFETAFSGFHPDLDWETVAGVPGRQRIRGQREVIEGFRELIAEFPDWRVEPQEFIEADDTILVRNVGTATGGKSGVPVRQPFTQVWTFRDGRPIRVREFLDHAEALAAVRLSE
jgi:ketosteroid isomerase-like protein